MQFVLTHLYCQLFKVHITSSPKFYCQDYHQFLSNTCQIFRCIDTPYTNISKWIHGHIHLIHIYTAFNKPVICKSISADTAFVLTQGWFSAPTTVYKANQCIELISKHSSWCFTGVLFVQTHSACWQWAVRQLTENSLHIWFSSLAYTPLGTGCTHNEKWHPLHKEEFIRVESTHSALCMTFLYYGKRYYHHIRDTNTNKDHNITAYKDYMECWGIH